MATRLHTTILKELPRFLTRRKRNQRLNMCRNLLEKFLVKMQRKASRWPRLKDSSKTLTRSWTICKSRQETSMLRQLAGGSLRAVWRMKPKMISIICLSIHRKRLRKKSLEWLGIVIWVLCLKPLFSAASPGIHKVYLALLTQLAPSKILLRSPLLGPATPKARKRPHQEGVMETRIGWSRLIFQKRSNHP